MNISIDTHGNKNHSTDFQYDDQSHIEVLRALALADHFVGAVMFKTRKSTIS